MRGAVADAGSGGPSKAFAGGHRGVNALAVLVVAGSLAASGLIVWGRVQSALPYRSRVPFEPRALHMQIALSVYPGADA